MLPHSHYLSRFPRSDIINFKSQRLISILQQNVPGFCVWRDGRCTIIHIQSFYLAARPYAEKNGAFIQGVLATFSEADALTRSQREQSIALLAKTMGLPAPVIASYLDHRPPTTIKPVNAEVAALQQQTADLFYENRLVPKKVDIRQRIWQPTQLEGKQL